MDRTPYSDVKISSTWDALIRVVAIGAALVIDWNAPFLWYWRVLMFLGIMFLVAITYHGVITYHGAQRAIAERNSN
jgi:hypothetical protein